MARRVGDARRHAAGGRGGADADDRQQRALGQPRPARDRRDARRWRCAAAAARSTRHAARRRRAAVASPSTAPEQPIRQDGRRVVLPIDPGRAARSSCAGASRAASRRAAASPAVDLGAPSVNARPARSPCRRAAGSCSPAGRASVRRCCSGALLPVRAARSRSASAAVRAHAAARAPLVPARRRPHAGRRSAWPCSCVGWLLALGWRRAARHASSGAAASTCSRSLLGGLDARRAGAARSPRSSRGCSARPRCRSRATARARTLLRWYQDRAAASLPRRGSLSVPLLVYRLLMLAWALWLAQALLALAALGLGGLRQRRLLASAAPPPADRGAVGRVPRDRRSPSAAGGRVGEPLSLAALGCDTP